MHSCLFVSGHRECQPVPTKLVAIAEISFVVNYCDQGTQGGGRFPAPDSISGHKVTFGLSHFLAFSRSTSEQCNRASMG